MLTTPSLSPLATSAPARLPAGLSQNSGKTAGGERMEEARDLKDAFQQFVGETFFGQMLKSMRQTVSEPAYFHGGMAEEQFQSRLDQQISQDMAASGAGGFADSLFTSQFPDEAALLASSNADPTTGGPQQNNALEALDTLRRR